MEPIYLDNNATTPLDPNVFEAMRRFLVDDFGNPSSAHRFGRPPREGLEEARRRVAACLGTRPDRIAFTRSGTEADGLAVAGRFAGRAHGRLITTDIEHPAVLETARALAGRGIIVEILPVDSDGIVCLETLEEALSRPADLVSIMLANNETGAVQPIGEASCLCRAKGVPLHTDAVNAAGKMPVRVDELRVDLLSLSAHKFHGPKGAGVLYMRDRSLIEPLFFGGGQEGGLSPGTENVAGAVGLAEALARATAALPDAADRMRELSERLLAGLRSLVPGIVENVSGEARLPNTLSLIIPGRDSTKLLARLDRAGIAVSAGAACHAGTRKPSSVLLAMGRTPEEALSTIRVSLSRFTTGEEIGRSLDMFRQVLAR
ncbi:MAG: cysteine desulfurase [Planctomycetes bacterium]|nr:cysteine desulfurase [Planctomycetota bacterium]